MPVGNTPSSATRKIVAFSGSEPDPGIHSRADKDQDPSKSRLQHAFSSKLLTLRQWALAKLRPDLAIAPLTLHPPIEPFSTRMLQVSPVHQIYVEESGNPKGIPVIFTHGGPAAGLGDKYRRLFDPKYFRIIGFDQRGCEKSTWVGDERPKGWPLVDNTTDDLVEDIQRIRKALGIDEQKYLIFGGSWGSTLALASAEKHPEDVKGLIVRGISLGRPEDTAWSTRPGEGVYKLYPEAGKYWAKGMEGHAFSEEDIKAGRDPALGIYDRLFNDPKYSDEERLQAVKYWRLGSTFEASAESLAIQDALPLEEYRQHLDTARIVCRYYYMNAFMDPSDKLIRDVARLRDIPHIAIINGADDINTPPSRAEDLHQAMLEAGIPHASKTIVQGAGHSAWAEGNTQALLKSLREFQEKNPRGIISNLRHLLTKTLTRLEPNSTTD